MTLTRFEFTRRVRPIMEVGIGSSDIDDAAALWDVALWDAPDSKWNGDEPLWRDVSCDVIGAHIEQGRGRISDPFPVGTADVIVDNHNGWADPSTDDFELDSTVGYFSFPGTAGNHVTSDVSDFTISGDISIMFRFRTSVWPPPWFTAVIAGIPGEWLLILQETGRLQLVTAGTAGVNIVESDPITPAADWRWYYVALDVNNGAGGHAWKFWYGGNDDDPQAWVLFSSGTAAGVLDIDNTANPLYVGTAIDNGFEGDISHVSIRSGFGPSLGVGGTVRWEFNGWDLRDTDVEAAEIEPRVGVEPMVVHRTGDPEFSVTAAVRPDAANLKLRPGRAIRVGVNHELLGDCWLYRGFIDEILPKDAPDDWSTVTLKCIDALGEAGRAKLSDDAELGAGEQARTRFARILNTIQWPRTKRFVSTSAIRTLYAAALDGQVVDLLRQTAESEGGWCYGDNEGRVVLQSRDWLYRVQGGDPDGTIGNGGSKIGPVMFAEDPPGSDLLAYLGDPGDWVEDAPDLMEWTGAP